MSRRSSRICEPFRAWIRRSYRTSTFNEEIDRTLALIEPRLKNRIEVERDYGALPRRYAAYASQLNQVFLNLLVNACDAIEDRQGNDSASKTRPTEDGVRVRGPATMVPGISEVGAESGSSIPSLRRSPIGVWARGLGLSLSHGIIERHNGRICSRVGAGPGDDLHRSTCRYEAPELERVNATLLRPSVVCE